MQVGDLRTAVETGSQSMGVESVDVRQDRLYNYELSSDHATNCERENERNLRVCALGRIGEEMRKSYGVGFRTRDKFGETYQIVLGLDREVRPMRPRCEREHNVFPAQGLLDPRYLK